MAALWESSGKSDSLNKECEGILSSYALFPFISYFSVLHLSDFLLLPWSALHRDKQKLLDNVEEMKISVRSNHNRAEEVKAHAKELARA
jgi:5'(3')-deoxyribonucleotidase